MGSTFPLMHRVCLNMSHMGSQRSSCCYHKWASRTGSTFFKGCSSRAAANGFQSPVKVKVWAAWYASGDEKGGEFFVVVGGSVDCWCCVNVDVLILGDKYLYFNLLNFYLHITGVPKRTSLIILLYSSINLE